MPPDYTLRVNEGASALEIRDLIVKICVVQCGSRRYCSSVLYNLRKKLEASNGLNIKGDREMPALRISCFGLPHAEVEGFGKLRFQTEKSLELLIITALSSESQMTRSVAAATLRMDKPEEQARRALSTDLWRLRAAFCEYGLDSNDYLDTSPRGIGIRKGAEISLDILIFEQSFDRLSGVPVSELTQEQYQKLSDIASMYRHDPLSNFDQEWCFVLRERLRSKYTALVDMLLQYDLAKDNWTSAIVWAQKLLEMDPMLEHAHRALMQCYYLTGNRGIAIRQYMRCVDVLERELQIAPSEETTRMYRGLLAVPIAQGQAGEHLLSKVSPLTRTPIDESDRKRSLTDQLSMALGNLNQARALVENVDATLRTKI